MGGQQLARLMCCHEKRHQATVHLVVSMVLAELLLSRPPPPSSTTDATSLTTLPFISLVCLATPTPRPNTQQGLPTDAPYRINVEKLYNYRLQLCETHQDVVKVESALGLGNIEEVISMGYDELNLIPQYIELKMHEK